MSDPAVDAANRVWQSDADPTVLPSVAAAREALKPLRDLHKPVDRGDGTKGCNHCWDCYDDYPKEWPCDTAELIYSTEELA